MPTTIQVDDDIHSQLADLKRALALKTKKDVDFNDTVRYLLEKVKR